MSIAASIVLVIGLSTSTLESTPNANQELTHFYETQIEAQLEVLEVSYQDQYAIPLQDIKQELRKVSALKINYTTRLGDYTQNIN